MKPTPAKIIGLPGDFDLLQSLREARAVTLSMAFAKKSGWLPIKQSLLSGDARVDILVGLNFEITDPDVLSDWLELMDNDPYRCPSSKLHSYQISATSSPLELRNAEAVLRIARPQCCASPKLYLPHILECFALLVPAVSGLICTPPSLLKPQYAPTAETLFRTLFSLCVFPS